MKPATSIRSVIATLAITLLIVYNARGQGTDMVTQDGFSLAKTANAITIDAGEVFLYDITCTVPPGATNVEITDQIPSQLRFAGASVQAIDRCDGSPVAVAEAWPSGIGGTYKVTVNSAGSCGVMVSIRLEVKFPCGTTCDSTMAFNRACVAYTLPGKSATSFCTDAKKVVTMARATDNWKVTQTVRARPGGALTNQGGSCPNAINDSVIVYNLTVSGGGIGHPNINNALVQFTLPPGAILISANCVGYPTPLPTQPSPLTQTLWWNVGNLTCENTTKSCTLEVLYPRASFPEGQGVASQVSSTAVLTGSLGDSGRCGRVYNEDTDCSEFVRITSGKLTKQQHVPVPQPGCTGFYKVTVTNTGNTNLTNFDIEDFVPNGLTYGNPTASGNLAAIGGSMSWNNPLPRVYIVVATPGLAPGTSISFTMPFTIPLSTPVGTTFQNCAERKVGGITVETVCQSFTVQAATPVIDVHKAVCSPKNAYSPGDALVYRIRIVNSGTATLTGATLIDEFNENLEYDASVPIRAYSSATALPACGTATDSWGASAVAGAQYDNISNTLSLPLANVSGDCNGNPLYYYLEIPVKVRAISALGRVCNTARIVANGVTVKTSNAVCINVSAHTLYFLKKEVKGLTSATTAAGAVVDYRLTMKIPVLVPPVAALRHVSFIDLLPMNDGADDRMINSCDDRKSEFSTTYSISSPTGALAYRVSSPLAFPSLAGWSSITSAVDASEFDDACSVTPGTTWASGIGIGDRYFGYYFGATPYVPGGLSFPEVSFNAKVDPSAAFGKVAHNTFVAGAAVRRIVNGVTKDQRIASAESLPDTLTIVGDDCSKCDTLTAESIGWLENSSDGRTFTITNAKTPASEIASIDINFDHEPTNRGGGGLTVNSLSRSGWTGIYTGPYLSAPNYSRIRFDCPGMTGANQGQAIAAGSTVSFNETLDRTFGGYPFIVTFKIGYCDGDTCEYTYRWDSASSAPTDPLTQPGTAPDIRWTAVVMTPLAQARSFSVSLREDSLTIVGATGPAADGGGDGNDLAGMTMQMAGNTVVYRARCIGCLPGPLETRTPITLNLFHTGGDGDSTVPVLVRYFDAAGREIGRREQVLEDFALGVDTETGRTAPRLGVTLDVRPNPASGTATVTVALEESKVVRIVVVDMQGREVRSLVEAGMLERGVHRFELDTRTLPNGTYVVTGRTRDGRVVGTPLKVVN